MAYAVQSVIFTIASIVTIFAMTVTSSGLDPRFSCPSANLIAPCTCQLFGLEVTIDCSNVPDVEFLITLFETDDVFGTTNMHTFTMVGNQNITAIPRNFFDLYTFKNVVITSNPFLAEVHPNAFVGLEGSLQRLDLSKNALTSLELLDNLAGFVNLGYLDLSNNRISATVTAFTCPPALLQLWLQNNQLRAIDPNAFATCTNLINLGVGGNPFTSFGANAFAGLENIEIITATNCPSLAVIQTGAFPIVSEKLDQLMLMDNYQLKLVEKDAITGEQCDARIQLRNCGLATLREETFRPLLEAFFVAGCGGYLDVTGCPLQCTCTMAWLLTDPGLKIHVRGRCASDGIEIVDQPEEPWIAGCY